MSEWFPHRHWWGWGVIGVLGLGVVTMLALLMLGASFSLAFASMSLVVSAAVAWVTR